MSTPSILLRGRVLRHLAEWMDACARALRPGELAAATSTREFATAMWTCREELRLAVAELSGATARFNRIPRELENAARLQRLPLSSVSNWLDIERVVAMRQCVNLITVVGAFDWNHDHRVGGNVLRELLQDVRATISALDSVLAELGRPSPGSQTVAMPSDLRSTSTFLSHEHIQQNATPPFSLAAAGLGDLEQSPLSSSASESARRDVSSQELSGIKRQRQAAQYAPSPSSSASSGYLSGLANVVSSPSLSARSSLSPSFSARSSLSAASPAQLADVTLLDTPQTESSSTITPPPPPRCYPDWRIPTMTYDEIVDALIALYYSGWIDRSSQPRDTQEYLEQESHNADWNALMAARDAKLAQFTPEKRAQAEADFRARRGTDAY